MSKITPSDNNFAYQRRMALERFMNVYEKEYKTIKKITHKCQYKCYGREDLPRNQAEECARTCLKPYIMQRKVNNEMLAKCEIRLQKSELECRKSSSLVSLDENECLKSALDQFDTCLQKEAPKVKNCVGEYIKAFDQIVAGKEEAS